MNKGSATRLTILQKAFELIYTRGYQTTSIDDIISTTKVTKGSFYYHFATKDEMGLAIIDEIVRKTMEDSFIAPLMAAGDPLKAIYTMMHDLLLKNKFLKVEYGCPAANLTQEMTPWNREFSNVLSQLVRQWQHTLEKVLTKAKKEGLIRKSIRPTQVSAFIISGYWGIRNLGKVYNSNECYHTYLKELSTYLDHLKVN